MVTITIPSNNSMPAKTVDVKPRPWWLFWVMPGYSITLYPYVYTPKMNITDPSRADRLMSICIHEAVHLEQQAPSKFMFYLKYLYSKKFRYASEFEAYMAEFRVLMQARCTPNIEGIAANLASAGYLWCVKKEVAIRDFTSALAKEF